MTDFTKSTKTTCGKHVKYIGECENKQYPHVFQIIWANGISVSMFSLKGASRDYIIQLSPPAERMEWWQLEKKVDGRWNVWGTACMFDTFSQHKLMTKFRLRHFITEDNNVITCETVWENQ